MNPSNCPRCGSGKISSNKIDPDGSGYWICDGCEYQWLGFYGS